MSKKGKVGTNGPSISAALYPKGRPETNEYKARVAAQEERRERARTESLRVAKRWGNRGGAR